jgi:hypothetical protein
VFGETLASTGVGTATTCPTSDVGGYDTLIRCTTKGVWLTPLSSAISEANAFWLPEKEEIALSIPTTGGLWFLSTDATGKYCMIVFK